MSTMEGAGETMVAIIQGLQDRALAVALVSGTRWQNCQKSRKKVPVSKSSAETSTEYYKRTVSAQIRDAQYASSYQLAHCRKDPTSPSPYLPEFPVQRRTPSQTKGNFRQVGSFGYGETSAAHMQQSSPGSFYHSSDFVDSLRKYPLPGRSASTDLVQRLLNYTQAKHLSRDATRSMRSLVCRPSRSTKHTSTNKHKIANKQASKASKNIQTYTRIVNEPYLKDKKSKRSIRRNTSYVTRPLFDQFTESYNYLKTSVSGRRSYTGHCSEVRYLNDVKRCIKETIRELVKLEPVSCSKVGNRYLEHCRLHHKVTESTTNPILNDNAVNTDPTKADAPTTTGIRRNDRCLGTTSSDICPKALRRYRSHRKLYHNEEINDNELFRRNDSEEESPAYCSPCPGTKRSCSLFPFPPKNCPHKDKTIAELHPQETNDGEEPDENVSDDDIVARVIEWLTQLPVFINNTPENQDIHLEMAQELINKLKGLKDRGDYDDHAMEAIEDFLNRLAVSAPEDGEEDEDISKIDEPVKIRGIIAAWFDDIDLDIRTKKRKLMSKIKFLEKFVDHLEPIVNKNGTREELNTELMKMLPKFDEEAFGSEVQDEISEHVENLVEQLYNIVQRREKRARQRIKGKNIKEFISDWLENLDDVSEDVKDQYRDLVQETERKIHELASTNAEDDVLAIEINNFLDSLPSDEIPLTLEQKDELTDHFINYIKPAFNVINFMNRQEKLKHARNLLNDIKPRPKKIFNNFSSLPASQRLKMFKSDRLNNKPAADSLENTSNVSKEIIKNNKDVPQKYDKKCQQLKIKDDNDDVIQEKNKEFTDSLPRKKTSLTPVQQSQLTKNLWNQTKSQKGRVTNRTAFNRLENTPHVSEDIEMKSRGVVKNLDKKLQSENVTEDLIEAGIKDFLDSLSAKGIIMSPAEKTRLTKIILGEIPVVNENKFMIAPKSVQPVRDWLDNAVNIPEDIKRNNRGCVENFDEKINELQAKNVSDNTLKKEITNFVNSMPDKGIPMSPTQKNHLVTNILNKVKSESKQRKRWNQIEQNEKTKKAILDEVSSIINNLPAAISSCKRREIIHKTADLFSSKLNRLQDSEIKVEIEKTLKEEANLSSHDVPSITNAIINRVKRLPLPVIDTTREFSIKMPSIRERVKKEIDSSLDVSDCPDSIDNNTTDVLDNQIVRGIDDDETKRNVKSILQNANVSENDEIQLTDKLRKQNKVMSTSHKLPDSTPRKSYPTLSPPEKLKLKKSTPNIENKHFISKKQSNTSVKSNSTNDDDNSDDVPRRRPRLICDSENNEDTYPDDDDDSEVYFYPKDYKPPAKVKKSKAYSKSLSAEIKYMQELIDIIKFWIYETSLNVIIDANLLETMPKDLSKNVVSMEKYLQRNKITQSDEEEVKNLRKEISKWLYKFIAYENFPTESQIQSLINEIRGFPMQRQRTKQSSAKDEQLLKSSSKDIKPQNTKSMISDLSSNPIEDYHDFTEGDLKEALSNWLKEQEIYQDMLPREKRIQENLAKDLGDRLISIMNNTPSHLDLDLILIAEIKKYVQKLPINYELKSNQSYMDGLANDILDYLRDLQLIQNISQHSDPSSINKHDDKWVNNLPLPIIDSSEKKNSKKLKDVLKDNIKQIGLEDEPMLKKETKNFLLNSPLELDDVKNKKIVLNKPEDQLIEVLKGYSHKIPNHESDKIVKEAVEQWSKTLNLPENDEDQDPLSEVKIDLTRTLLNNVIYADNVPSKRVDDIFRGATGNFLEKLPQHPYQSEHIDKLAKSLQDTLNNVSRKYFTLSIDSVKRKATDTLLDDIFNWAKNLPIKSDTPEDELEAKNIKLEIETKLIHKIGELNMNSEVFNDDFLYEDILGDEVVNLLVNIPSDNLKKNQPKLKKEFLDIIIKARDKIREEKIGRVYKLQLRETIAKTLPHFDLSAEGQQLFEVLKDNIADAYINMHYVGNDEQEIYRFKKKINDDIYNFYYNHLKRCPVAPLDTRKFNDNLYESLDNIIEPQNESFSYEVQLIKIKDMINDWVNELPLNLRTGQDKLQINKMLSVLANKLHEIENLRALDPREEYDDKMIKEITFFLKKLPLNTNDDEAINQLSEKLVKNLRDTEESRKLNASTRHSIQHEDSCSCYVPPIPPSALSKEDQDHLKRIRKRTLGLRRQISSKDVSLSPCPVDAGCQTEIKSSSFGVCPIRSGCFGQRNSSAQTFTRRIKAVGSQIDDYVNEHHRDSADTSCMQHQDPSPCPAIPRTSFDTVQQPQRRLSPKSRSPCISRASKSCLANRPSTPHTSQIQFQSPQRSLAPSCHEYQLSRRPCKPEQLLQSQAGIQSSVPDSSTVHQPISDKNTSRLGSQSPHHLLRHASPYPYDTSTEPSSDQDRQRTKYSGKSSQYPNQPFSASYEQRNNRETLSAYDEPVSAILPRIRRLRQNNQLRTCGASHSPLLSQGQSCMTPQTTLPFGPSQEMPCSRGPLPSYTRPEPPISSEDYEPEPSCSFQKRFHNWNNYNYQHCERDRNRPCMLSGEELHQVGKRCSYESKCGRYRERRKLFHLHDDETMTSCSKCCGVHCPYPSYLFFR